MFFMEIRKSRQWVLYLAYKTCGLYFFSVFIVYVSGKFLLSLRNKTISFKTFFFFFNLYPKIFLLSCIKNQVLWKFIALMNGVLVSEEFL